jgi:hypothetical protein
MRYFIDTFCTFSVVELWTQSLHGGVIDELFAAGVILMVELWVPRKHKGRLYARRPLCRQPAATQRLEAESERDAERAAAGLRPIE